MRNLLLALALVVVACLPDTPGWGQRNHTTLSGVALSGGAGFRNAVVSLYLAGDSRNPARLIGQARTNPAGRFTIVFSGPAGSAPLYLLAQGGPYFVSGQTAIRLAALAGTADQPAPRVVIDELTTVATAYCYAQFIRGPQIAGNRVGIRNAALVAANLANPATGQQGDVILTSPNGADTTTLAALNSLANLLAVCSQSGPARARLFDLATPPGGPRPTETLTALSNIARYPGRNAGGLFALSAARRLYGPALDAAPSSWVLPIKFADPSMGMDGPGAFAFDAEGNLWMTNNYVFGTTTSEPCDYFIKLQPNGQLFPGAPFFGGGLYGGAWGLAIDEAGRAWQGNFAQNPNPPVDGSVSLFTADGTPLSPDGTGFTEGNISRAQGIGIDRLGNVWIANFGNDSLTEYIGGDPNQPLNFTGGGLDQPFGLAIDGQRNIWLTNGKGNSVSKFGPDGTPAVGSPFAVDVVMEPKGIAIDTLGNAWISSFGNFDGRSVVALKPNGDQLPFSPITAGAIWSPWGIAVDGRDNIWVANFGGPPEPGSPTPYSHVSITNLAGANPATRPAGYRAGEPISPPGGYTSNAMEPVTAVAIDASGNVWTANNWQTIPPNPGNPGGNGALIWPGLAPPVRMPLIGPPRQP